MELPKPRKNVFLYEMYLIFTCMDYHLFRKIPRGLLEELRGDTDAISSLLAGLLYSHNLTKLRGYEK